MRRSIFRDDSRGKSELNEPLEWLFIDPAGRAIFVYFIHFIELFI